MRTNNITHVDIVVVFMVNNIFYKDFLAGRCLEGICRWSFVAFPGLGEGVHAKVSHHKHRLRTKDKIEWKLFHDLCGCGLDLNDSHRMISNSDPLC